MSEYSLTFRHFPLAEAFKPHFPQGCLLVLAGNRHLHWGWVPRTARTLADLMAWDTPPLTAPLDSATGRAACSALWDACLDRWTQALGKMEQAMDPWRKPDLLKQSFLEGTIPLRYASVVPPQTEWLRPYPLAQALTLADIPLRHTYPTLGVDRALALWTAGELQGWPAIVIDGGTALTLTGGNEQGELVGGAILPGVGLQFQSLFQHTAALPLLSLEALPDRWACNTSDAILSGVAYTLLAGVKSFLQDWLQTYPHTQICFTGGDGQWLYQHLLPWLRVQALENPKLEDPEPVDRVTYHPHLGLWGMQCLISG